LATTEGKNARTQIISAAIRTRRGELNLDVERGIPYFDTIFKSASRQNVQLWEAFVRKTVNDFDFVKSIMSFDYEIDYQTGVVKYKLVAEGIDGEEIVVASE
jgi:hypothetical protein